ncbi:MAG: hypothetical protein ACYC6W_05620 [Nitrosotalea sp.]
MKDKSWKSAKNDTCTNLRMKFQVNSLWHFGQVLDPTSAELGFLGLDWYPHFMHDPVVKADMITGERHSI